MRKSPCPASAGAGCISCLCLFVSQLGTDHGNKIASGAISQHVSNCLLKHPLKRSLTSLSVRDGVQSLQTGWGRCGCSSREWPCPGTSAHEPYGGHGALLLFLFLFWQILLAEHVQDRNNSSAQGWYLVVGETPVQSDV